MGTWSRLLTPHHCPYLGKVLESSLSSWTFGIKEPLTLDGSQAGNYRQLPALTLPVLQAKRHCTEAAHRALPPGAETCSSRIRRMLLPYLLCKLSRSDIITQSKSYINKLWSVCRCSRVEFVTWLKTHCCYVRFYIELHYLNGSDHPH